MSISWMSTEDDAKAYNAACRDCETCTINHPRLHKTPCSMHALEYAGQPVWAIKCDFLDPENPKVGENFINSLIIDPDQNLHFLLDHIRADEDEGRTTVLSLTTKMMTRDDLNTLGEWEP